jgi:alpha-tubulin suppressor-like RCC1 family protein
VSLVAYVDTLTSIGDTLMLSATAYDDRGAPIANATLTWETSAEDVATVTAQGLVVARGNGTAMITVHAGSARDSAAITVEQRAARLIFLVQPRDVLEGDTLTPRIEVAVLDARGHTVSTAAGDVELSITPSGTLEGATTAQPVDGVAVFDDLRVIGAGSGYRIEARYDTLPVARSGFFDVYLPFAQLSAGGLHTCGITVWGETYCWGLNVDGRVGDGTTEDRNRPVRVAAAGEFRLVDAGSPATWALAADGVVYGWGGDDLVPTVLAAPVPFDTIVSRWHTCAIAADGKAYCWGGMGAAFGGERSDAPVTVPAVAMGGEAVVEIATGDYFTCALRTDRTAWCAGNNSNGELGNGTTTFSNVPTPVQGRMAFKRLAVGDEFACGITVEGPTYCWGANKAGQLGNPDAGEFSAAPVEVAGGHAFTELSLGKDHACALTADGTAYCWGAPDYGKLGVDRADPPSEPVRVSDKLAFRAITAASFHTCAIATDGYTYCWGNNLYGELGDGGKTAGPMPRRVAAPWL